MKKDISTIVDNLSLLLIKAYQLTKGMRPSCCRFYPSCSEYSAQAIQKYGLLRGVSLGMRRLLKCHPWHHGGVDFSGLS